MIVPKSPMAPSNHQETKAVSAQPGLWESAIAAVHEDTDSQLVARKSLIPQILFHLPPALSVVEAVTSRHNVRRTRRGEYTRTAGAASCVEKLTTWRGTVN